MTNPFGPIVKIQLLPTQGGRKWMFAAELLA